MATSTPTPTPTTIPSINQPDPPNPIQTSPSSTEPTSEEDLSTQPHPHRLSRPTLGSRKSSGTIIVSREELPAHNTSAVFADSETYTDDDVRAMSPRRNTAEVDQLGEEARRELVQQALELQTGLQAICDRVESVRCEHEKLEGGNKFLQS